jgi:hypothetical protein
MASFIDVTCPKCGRKHGWLGEMKDRPPCPKCKHQVPYDPNDPDQKEMDLAKEMLRQKMLKEVDSFNLQSFEPVHNGEYWIWAKRSLDDESQYKHLLPIRLFVRLIDGEMIMAKGDCLTYRRYHLKENALKDLENAKKIP